MEVLGLGWFSGALCQSLYWLTPSAGVIGHLCWTAKSPKKFCASRVAWFLINWQSIGAFTLHCVLVMLVCYTLQVLNYIASLAGALHTFTLIGHQEI